MSADYFVWEKNKTEEKITEINYEENYVIRTDE